MIGLDTSVVIRYLVGAPPTQALAARTLIDGPGEFGLPLVAVLETAHVLRTRYGASSDDVLDALIGFVSRANVTVLGLPNLDVLDALVRARAIPSASIGDALIAAEARAAGALPLYTFDAGLGRHGTEVATP